MDDLCRGDDGLHREIGLVHVLHHPLAHQLRRAGALPDAHLLQGSVGAVDRLVEGGHIDARDTGRLPEQLLLGPVLVPGPAVEGDVLQGDLLPLPQHEEVHKGGQGFRVIGAGPPRHHQRGQVPPLLRAQRQARQIQHVQHIGVGHLVAQRESDNVKVAQRIAALQAVQLDALPAHLLLHVSPGSKSPLAPQALNLVHGPIQDTHPQVGHTDLIGVWKAEGIPGVHLGPILHHRIIFSAGVTGGLLYFWQNTLQCPVHDVPPGNSHFECRNHFTRF